MLRRVLTLVSISMSLLGAPPMVSAENGKVDLLWLGHSAVRISSPGGKTIVVDPFITANPKTPPEWKDLDKLGKVDVVLVTHAHTDHVLDAPAITKKNNIKCYGPAGLADTLAELGILTADEAPRMNKGGTITPVGPDIKMTAVHADHSSEFVYTNPETKKREVHVGGEPMGWIIKLENGFTIYHMGDTTLFSDMKLIADTYKPDLLLVPIGGHFVMDPQVAAEATRLVRPKYVLPIHYGTTPQLKGTPEEYKAALGATKVKVLSLKPGESTSF